VKPDRAQPPKLLGPLESEVMEIIWESGRPMSVRELLERINDGRDPELAYTTVMTVMSRLVDKGILRRTRKGRGYIYEATASDAAGIAVRNVMRQFGDAAMAHFVEEARADPKALRRLQRLLGGDS
jgi:predicted transcriptional regulator